MLPVLPCGIDIVFGGDLPSGAGISSSSAITCGFIVLVNHLFDFQLCDEEIISLASQAENGIGLQGGQMDQTTIVKGRQDHALLLDFLSKSIQEINLDLGNHHFYIFDSGQKHNLVNTAYNTRRNTCESAIEKLKTEDPSISTFRNVKKEHLASKSLSIIERNRCEHIVNENDRVLKTVSAFKEGNISDIGSLLFQSHSSLSDLYEVSTDEIDYLISLCKSHSKILGARIMGGGFGGSTINLVNGLLTENEICVLQQSYKNKTGLQLDVIKVTPSDGIRYELF